MNPTPEIVLEPGTHHIRMSQIPERMARAVLPVHDQLDPAASDARAFAQAMEEERIRKVLYEAIQSGELIPRSKAGTLLSEGERMSLELGYLPFENFRTFASKWPVTVRIQPTVAACEAVEAIANRLRDDTRKKWDGEENKEKREEIALAHCDHHVMAQLKALVAAGNIVPRDAATGVALNGELDFGFSCDLYWNITDNDAAKLAAEAIRNPIDTLHEVAAQANKSAENAQIHSAQLAKKSAAGRYALDEAARVIARETGANYTNVLKAFLAEVKERRLTVYEPGQDFPTNPSPPRFYYEAYWDEINTCLDRLKFRGAWRFQAPDTSQSKLSEIAGDDRPEWTSHAQRIVRAYMLQPVNHQRSQRTACEHAAREMEKQGIRGPRETTLDWQTVKKQAIQGDWWQANKSAWSKA